MQHMANGLQIGMGLTELDGVEFPVAVNGQHLNKYFQSMWDDGQ
jgi:hypothetical protein